jgi:hypothetical protein
MTRLSILAAVAALVLPASAFAADASDATLTEFENICGAAQGNYVNMLSDAASNNWTETQVVPDTDTSVSVTAQAAREKTVGDATLTLLANQGVRHTSGGDLAQTVCKISSNKPDAGIDGRVQSWLGFPADASNQGLTVYYFHVVNGKPEHLAGQAAIQQALNSGGFSFVKIQADSGATILVYQTYSK